MTVLTALMFGILTTGTAAQNQWVEKLAPVEVIEIPGGWFDTFSRSRRWEPSSLISEDGERLYVIRAEADPPYIGITQIGLRIRFLRSFEVYESALIPGFPLIGGWQHEINDSRWGGPHEHLHSLENIKILSEPTPNNIVIYHRTRYHVVGADRPISTVTTGLSQVALDSDSAHDNLSLLRFTRPVNEDNGFRHEMIVQAIDVSEDQYFLKMRGSDSGFMFRQGAISPAPPVKLRDRTVLALDSRQSILAIDPGVTKQSLQFLVLAWPNVAMPRLEAYIPHAYGDTSARAQVNIITGRRLLVSIWQEMRPRESQVCYVVNASTGGRQELGAFSVLATSRSGKWVLFGSWNSDDPAYLLRF